MFYEGPEHEERLQHIENMLENAREETREEIGKVVDGFLESLLEDIEVFQEYNPEVDIAQYLPPLRLFVGSVIRMHRLKSKDRGQHTGPRISNIKESGT